MIKTLIPGRSVILHSLPENLSTRLFRDATPRHVTAGEALFHAGDPGDGCYRLEHGLLKVLITSPRGEERILAILGPGAIAGELSVIDGGSRSASVFAVKECDLSFVRRAAFEEYAQQHPEIYRFLLDVLAARLRETDEAVAAASFMTVKSRLARALLELAKVLGEENDSGQVLIRHKIKQSDLAVMAGIARENVNRALSDWKRRKVVSKSKGYYCLQDIATLKRIVDK
jgi:CRP-like cAMP-binding protein